MNFWIFWGGKIGTLIKFEKIVHMISYLNFGLEYSLVNSHFLQEPLMPHWLMSSFWFSLKTCSVKEILQICHEFRQEPWFKIFRENVRQLCQISSGAMIQNFSWRRSSTLSNFVRSHDSKFFVKTFLVKFEFFVKVFFLVVFDTFFRSLLSLLDFFSARTLRQACHTFSSAVWQYWTFANTWNKELTSCKYLNF